MKLLIFLPLCVALVSCQTTSLSEQQMQDLSKKIIENLKQSSEFSMAQNRWPQSGASANAQPKQKQLKRKVFKKIVIGRVEWIGTISPKINFRARIDTGAQTCSMHAENIVEKDVDGERYVEFTTLDEEGNPHSFLKKVVKVSSVKSTSGVAEKRYVVKVNLSFGKRELLVNVNLNDRRNLKHRFLVGRNLMMGNYIVDVSQSRLLGEEP